MSLKGAFKKVISMQERPMKFYRTEDINTKYDIRAARSNYFRNPAAPEDLVFEGYEFIIDKDHITKIGLDPLIKRGDRIVDPEYGDMSIKEIRPETDLGGGILFYRVRVEV